MTIQDTESIKTQASELAKLLAKDAYDKAFEAAQFVEKYTSKEGNSEKLLEKDAYDKAYEAARFVEKYIYKEDNSECSTGLCGTPKAHSEGGIVDTIAPKAGTVAANVGIIASNIAYKLCKEAYIAGFNAATEKPSMPEMEQVLVNNQQQK